jgi:hypothetical protein
MQGEYQHNCAFKLWSARVLCYQKLDRYEITSNLRSLWTCSVSCNFRPLNRKTLIYAYSLNSLFMWSPSVQSTSHQRSEVLRTVANEDYCLVKRELTKIEAPPKWRQPRTLLHGISSQKTVTFMFLPNSIHKNKVQVMLTETTTQNRIPNHTQLFVLCVPTDYYNNAIIS